MSMATLLDQRINAIAEHEGYVPKELPVSEAEYNMLREELSEFPCNIALSTIRPRYRGVRLKVLTGKVD